MASRGKLFVISAPSGAGKTTLVHRLMERAPGLGFSISYTTRTQRPGEVDGRDYFFVDEARFRQLLQAGELLEHAEVFGHHYGTSRRQVEQLLAAGQHVLLEIDWQGARQVRANLPDSVSMFILPPSLQELERRLRSRGTDSEAVIARRLGEALDDMRHWPEFDYLIINDEVDRAVAALQEILAGRGKPWSTRNPAQRRRAEAVLAGH